MRKSKGWSLYARRCALFIIAPSSICFPAIPFSFDYSEIVLCWLWLYLNSNMHCILLRSRFLRHMLVMIICGDRLWLKFNLRRPPSRLWLRFLVLPGWVWLKFLDSASYKSTFWSPVRSRQLRSRAATWQQVACGHMRHLALPGVYADARKKPIVM